ncbi:hypothetical protein Salat_1655200 [Sesamum alatum]|uniref:Uncharacterized protein n=1 Tax=Sesamum alatum TaxID=300844 RepID=A0AAE1Y6H9_9LAMI|nr:hypothetical protein Salat_1655200 [Sesamum alatum]
MWSNWKSILPSSIRRISNPRPGLKALMIVFLKASKLKDLLPIIFPTKKKPCLSVVTLPMSEAKTTLWFSSSVRDSTLFRLSSSSAISENEAEWGKHKPKAGSTTDSAAWPLPAKDTAQPW